MVTNIADLQQKSKLPAKQAGVKSVKAFFKQNEAAVMEAAPEEFNSKRLMSVVLGALRTTPKLQECTIQSLFGAVLSCAQLGLEPNTPNGHAYLVPFKNRKRNTTDVQVIIGYRGLIDMARRSGQITNLAAHEVCEQDEFSYEYGLNEHCRHIPAEGDRGEITHFYATAHYVGGGHSFEVMTRREVEAIRDASQNWQTAKRYNKEKMSPWHAHFDQMGRKTAMRRLYKWLPTSVEMMQAAHLQDKHDKGQPQELDHTLDADFVDLGVMPEDYEPDQDEPATDSTGEIFDPEKHLAVDKLNQDGSFTKRPQRGKSKDVKKADPLEPIIAAMEAAGDEAMLAEAREDGNDPDLKLDDVQKLRLDDVFHACMEKLKGGGAADPDEGFGGLE